MDALALMADREEAVQAKEKEVEEREEGVGERAAMALATTTALGGTRHGDRKSLAEWAARDGGEKLKHFLLTSEELGGAILTSPGLVLALNNTKLPGDSL